MDIEEIKRFLVYNEELAAEYRKIVNEQPSGSLVLHKHRSGNESPYLHTTSFVDGRRICKRVAVSKGLMDIAIAIKRRQFCLKSLSIIEKNILAIENLLRHYIPYEPEITAAQLGSAYKKILLVLHAAVLPPSDSWRTMEARQNLGYPEGLRHEGPRGLYRSKSEVMIAMELEKYKISFKYEPAIILGDRTVYPDFAIFSPKTKQIVYWEHAGMLDNKEYAENLWVKLREYNEHGITIGHNLVVTTETAEKPLSVIHIEDVVKIFFCV